ncbi:UNVERIFIED_CONTAM: Calmodulin binding protein PICBP [Sesamum latifolium]|uniref:Calmodulin binding protein PICBP n=1 Tax=Sesamum latifolium TaxID=2727402 RepID=A0AAW2XHM3_9LAMI
MESCDSSPNYIRARPSFDAKKENSPGGSDCEDMISVSSSTCGSAINGPCPKLTNSLIKHRTSNNKTVSNFGSVRSFRRRAKSRFVRSPVTLFDDTATSHCGSVAGSSESLPHYLKATSCSEGKKTHSPQHKSLQALSRTSSLRSVRILIKKTSFKLKRASAKVSEDVAVDRATYSSTLKDSKFPEPVEVHNGGTELEKTSAVKVCRYHHCSLHGHCHGSHDPVPPPKRFLYKRRRTLKKQKSILPKTESSNGAKDSSGRKKNLQKSRIVPIVETLDRQRVSDGITFSGVENENGKDSSAEIYAKQEAQLFGDGYDAIREAALIEIAFGARIGGPSGANGYCFRCSCHIKERVTSSPRQTDADLSLRKVASSSLDDGYKSEIPQNGDTYAVDSNPSVLFEKPKELVGTDVEDTAALDIENQASNKVCPDTPVISSEATRKNSMFSSASDSNSDEEGNITTESTSSRDSRADNAMQVKDAETNSPTHEGSKLQFSKRSHMSMWNLIHQHMSSNVAASAEKQLQRADGESPVDGSDSLPAKESSTSGRELRDSDMGTVNYDSEIQDIEVRKLFAIKFVREAIEKILLPEVQDQTSDDQSITGENTPRPEIIEKNQSEGPQLIENNQSEVCVPENDGETNAHEGDGNMSSNSEKESHTADDASGPEVKETDDASCPKITETNTKVVSKSEKKAPKHWSNLKKWILLQRFIRELEKVRKFNPRKPRHLPLNPDPEAEKVNLRPQTVDERKNAEEWMLDYALRQAVSQLAPTQKRKVALLVKAFETVVPTQEEPQAQFRIPRLNSNGSDICSVSYKVDESVSDGYGRSKEEAPVTGKAMLNQETGDELVETAEKLYDSNDNSCESLVKSQSSVEKRTGMFTSIMKSVLSSSKNENPRETAGGHKGANVILRSGYFNGEFMPSDRNIKPEGPESESGEPSLPTESLILDGNGKSAATEGTPCPASHAESLEEYMADETETEAIPTAQCLQEDATSDRKEGQTKHSGRSSTEMDRKNHIKMWHMIYQHVVSGIAERVGNQLLDGADEEEGEDNNSPAINDGDYPNGFSQPTDDSSEKDHVPSNLSGGFTKSDALKLIKEAVDEILLPEIQDDSSDTQSVTSESISDQDFLERNSTEIGGQNFSSEDGVSMDEEGKSLVHDAVSTQDEMKAESKVSKKSELPKAKNWSKLKKLILLKRSIKALEKARKLKPQPHQSSPQTPDPEPEKIDLKSQMMDERKKAEQWMLDYAVQHIVTKLTPARKRRVSMLVEAFEAVVPLPET